MVELVELVVVSHHHAWAPVSLGITGDH